MPSRSGFTLIELSIVLVIIGLIIGGVLVGRDLIKAAEIRQDISQIEKISVAVNAFKLKYNCLPGDCARATNFFGSASQPTQVRNGNGDGIILGGRVTTPEWNTVWWYSMHASAEWFEVFDQLSAAKLWNIEQYDETDVASNVVGVGFPKMKRVDSTSLWASYDKPGGIVTGYDLGAYHVKAGHKIRLSVCGSIVTGTPGFGCGMRPDTASIIDTKLDDGKPYTGTVVLGSQGMYVNTLPGSPNSDNTVWCGNSATNEYLINTGDGYCALIINAAY